MSKDKQRREPRKPKKKKSPAPKVQPVVVPGQVSGAGAGQGK